MNSSSSWFIDDVHTCLLFLSMFQNSFHYFGMMFPKKHVTHSNFNSCQTYFCPISTSFIIEFHVLGIFQPPALSFFIAQSREGALRPGDAGAEWQPLELHSARARRFSEEETGEVWRKTPTIWWYITTYIFICNIYIYIIYIYIYIFTYIYMYNVLCCFIFLYFFHT